MSRHLLTLACALLLIGSLGGCTRIVSATTDQPIEANPTKRSIGNVIDDQWIETTVVVNARKSHPELEHARLVAVSYNGVVLLAGQAPTAEARTAAAEAASRVKNVRRVHNELGIAPNSGLLARSSDTVITSKVKSKLLLNRSTDGTGIKVVTEHGVVYLLGLVTPEMADQATQVAQATSGVQKVVRIFEYVE